MTKRRGSGIYRPLFAAAAPPDPDRGDWSDWERLLLDQGRPTRMMKRRARCASVTERGFGTVSSALIALPSPERGDQTPKFRFAAHHPRAEGWHDISRVTRSRLALL